jgi:hypothetical protein
MYSYRPPLYPVRQANEMRILKLCFPNTHLNIIIQLNPSFSQQHTPFRFLHYRDIHITTRTPLPSGFFITETFTSQQEHRYLQVSSLQRHSHHNKNTVTFRSLHYRDIHITTRTPLPSGFFITETFTSQQEHRYNKYVAIRTGTPQLDIHVDTTR